MFSPYNGIKYKEQASEIYLNMLSSGYSVGFSQGMFWGFGVCWFSFAVSDIGDWLSFGIRMAVAISFFSFLFFYKKKEKKVTQELIDSHDIVKEVIDENKKD